VTAGDFDTALRQLSAALTEGNIALDQYAEILRDMVHDVKTKRKRKKKYGKSFDADWNYEPHDTSHQEEFR
jgi:hypothetical protein